MVVRDTAREQGVMDEEGRDENEEEKEGEDEEGRGGAAAGDDASVGWEGGQEGQTRYRALPEGVEGVERSVLGRLCAANKLPAGEGGQYRPKEMR